MEEAGCYGEAGIVGRQRELARGGRGVGVGEKDREAGRENTKVIRKHVK